MHGILRSQVRMVLAEILLVHLLSMDVLSISLRVMRVRILERLVLEQVLVVRCVHHGIPGHHGLFGRLVASVSSQRHVQWQVRHDLQAVLHVLLQVLLLHALLVQGQAVVDAGVGARPAAVAFAAAHDFAALDHFASELAHLATGALAQEIVVDGWVPVGVVDELVERAEDCFEGVEGVLVVGVGRVLVHQRDEQLLGALGPYIPALDSVLVWLMSVGFRG